jgi:hypothetical protein
MAAPTILFNGGRNRRAPELRSNDTKAPATRQYANCQKSVIGDRIGPAAFAG